jgi:hypothetical protein
MILGPCVILVAIGCGNGQDGVSAHQRAPTQPASPPGSKETFEVRVTVDPSRPLHTISPTIFGASAVEPGKAHEFGLTTVRWGGNRSSRYNWKTRADNAGSTGFS